MRKKRLVIGIVLGSLALFGLTAIVVVWLSFSRLGRFSYLSCYSGALQMCREIHPDHAIPDSIEQFVQAHIDEIPQLEQFPRPQFRPIREEGEGPFLVLIEASRKEWYHFKRCVIYTDSRYHLLDFRFVTAGELAGLLAEDDRRRAAAKAASRPAPGDDRMGKMFGNMDLTQFWEESEFARSDYQDDPLTDEQVATVQRRLGYKLPRAYIELMKLHNGGIPRKTNHRTKEATSWAPDHVAISGIFPIGTTKPNALCGESGSQFWIDEWGYPPIGIYFADCPSAGHDMLCLDYRECGPNGEPRVVHIDQELDYKITIVSENFESFIRGLEDDDAFDEP